ncbi:leukocidin family pore-forming toxin [Parashewanella tropica]|uniref:leukocidin family pore-forming toxin n=1 Tax=Parashewanella tropica TaxID=2547970 RepID=UPI001059273A|nr:leukocidin family pore-forming toxin [Parashewanella tropica]
MKPVFSINTKKALLCAALLSASTAMPIMAKQAPSVFAQTYLQLPQEHLAGVYYVNIDNADLVSEREKIFSEVKLGNLVLLDATEVDDKNNASQKLSTLLGIGVVAPITLVYEQDGELYTHAINNQVDYDESNYHSVDFDLLNQNIMEAIGQASSGVQTELSASSDALIAQKAVASSAGRQPYRFGVSRKLRISENLSCAGPQYLNHDSWDRFHGRVDECSSNRSKIDVTMTLRMLRSTGSQDTDNAKFFRVTVNKQDGTGAGIHLSNAVSINSHWPNNMDRKHRLSPIIGSFEQSVHPLTNTSNMSLHNTYPDNTALTTEYSETSGFTIGGGVSASAEVSDGGPKVGAGANVGFSINASRTIKYLQSEYRVKQASNGLTGRFVYERNEHECALLKGSHGGGCTTTSGWGDADHIIDASRNRISPVAYANFKPNFDYIYRAEPHKRGTSNFELNTTLKIARKYATRSITGCVFFCSRNIMATQHTTFNRRNVVTVNWDHPAFEPEPNVYLKAEGHNNQCLAVPGNNPAVGTSVITYSCNNDWIDQTWGLDDKMRYRSRVAPDRCLTVMPNNQVKTQACTTNNDQRWEWVGKKLKTLANGKEGFVLQFNAHGQSVTVAPELPASASAQDKRKQEWGPFLTNLSW